MIQRCSDHSDIRFDHSVFKLASSGDLYGTILRPNAHHGHALEKKTERWASIIINDSQSVLQICSMKALRAS